VSTSTGVSFPRVAHRAEHTEAVVAGEHHVEDHEIHGNRADLVQRVRPGRRPLDLVPVGRELAGDAVRHVVVALHDQDARHRSARHTGVDRRPAAPLKPNTSVHHAGGPGARPGLRPSWAHAGSAADSS
jgi:hypothetical protein